MFHRTVNCLACTVSLVLVFFDALAWNLSGEDAIHFNRDIRPILSDNCFACHGPDQNARKAKMRLDLEDTAKSDRDGGRVIDSEEPEKSLLLQRIQSTDPDEIMPPADSGKSLSENQKALLSAWIQQGGQYEGHWAYIQPQRPALPESPYPDKVKNSIDSFIQSRLGSKDLKPAPLASRNRLARRIHLDLIGLPPSQKVLNEFVNNPHPESYENLVDQLLDSPHFGERMAAPWLDLVRFADTIGYHGDQLQNVFPYRDYVIDSFNENKPFDVFTMEQIAGDLLPNPSVEALVATCFNRLNMMTREGGAQAKEYIAKYQADRVRTVSTAWLGSTLACAECHDHKFDPFSTRDFYAMSAFFGDIKQWGVYGNYGYLGGIPEFEGFNNESPFPPEIEVENDYLKQRQDQLENRMLGLFQEVAALESTPEPRAEWEDQLKKYLALRPAGWTVPTVVEVESDKGTSSRLQDNGSILFLGKPQGGEKHEIQLQPIPGQLSTLRLEVIPHAIHRNKVARDDREQFKLRLSVRLKKGDADESIAIPFHHADADKKRPGHWRALPRLDILSGWESEKHDVNEQHTAYYRLNQPQHVESGNTLILTLHSDDVGCVRVSLSPIGMQRDDADVPSEKCLLILEQKPEDRSTENQAFLTARWILSTGQPETAFQQFKDLEKEILACRDGRAMVMVTEQRDSPLTTRVLPRGNWQDESGEIVQPGIPEFLGPLKPDKGRPLSRLDLAKWLVSPDNPLTARVFVNRLWKQFFGTGLSNVIEDVGSQGEWPTHPLLLDWLAVEFMESGWDIKHMIKLIVTSYTYQQTSNVGVDEIDKDPLNRFYARQSPRRLDAESVRDNALFISGLLNTTTGGPSAHPYQPDGYYAHLNFPRREYEPDLDFRQYRRGVYTHWQRTFLHPMLANFDASSREECSAARTVSNTPQQALNLLNDPSFVEAARAFADELLLEHPNGEWETILKSAFQRSLARSPSSKEIQSLKRLFNNHLNHFKSNPEAALNIDKNGIYKTKISGENKQTERAAWISLCRVLLNLHETITIY